MLDTGCERLVVGYEWFLDFESRLRLRFPGFQAPRYPETEFYRFGPGSRKPSLFAGIVPVALGHCVVTLRMSVVKCRVPLLISHTVIQDLDMIYRARTGECQ